MIWEVDEDCDGSLSWPEFQQMHHRCDNDATGKLHLCAHVSKTSSVSCARNMAADCTTLLSDGTLSLQRSLVCMQTTSRGSCTT